VLANKQDRVASVKMMESLRDRVLFTYFKSLELAKKPITIDSQEISSIIWDDMVDTVVMAGGDIGILLEAGLEVIINNAVEDYIKNG
jgi:hypothetical protein